MTLGQIALDVIMAAVGLSLVSIAFFCLAGVGLAVMTVVRAGRPARPPARRLHSLAHGCAVADLADIDRALDAILAEERGFPAPHGRVA